ncbi:MAG TPA: ABC transporter substrate-binding protein [Casimicrobiaceae bacterium]|nr:ABC transporter substrate-binding protein [Casimicrobiaceae bacterium]
MKRRQLLCTLAIVTAALVLGTGAAVAQQKSEINITRQPGILYLPSHVMEKQRLVEKHARELGLPDLKVNWLMLSGGGSQTDAMLSGSVDVVNTGVGNLLLLWDRTKGGVKGIVANSALPLALVTRNPAIKSLKDYTPEDRIAVPTLKVSTQAILLQMAAEKVWGEGQMTHLDANMVQLGHPDAALAMSNPTHEITSHFAAPPFQFYELKKVPGAHIVISSPQIIGGPLTQSQFFTTTKFADANPRVVQAIKDASLEAIEYIKKDTRGAVEIYRQVTGDKTSADELVDLLRQPGMMDWIAAPQGTMKFAAHLYKVGTLKTLPKDWKEYYLSTAHDLPGN